jgi:2-methylcitrate dehydratase PrpD
VLDTLAAITAGHRQDGVEIAREYAAARFDGDDATLLDGTGTTLGAEGATLANAVAANALDVDDGHREVKGHPAAVVVPAALAAAETVDAGVEPLLDAVYVGYELAVRTGLAVHETDGVYTGTGSWGALGAAAAVGRLRGFSAASMANALAVAEYHAPRTPIMRGVERPGMTKDGIGWGAYAGVAAAHLAESGFTGSGTVFDEPTVDVTDSLGETYETTRGYLKPYPCCRWAQPGLEAALELSEAHGLDSATVDAVRIETFSEATRLATRAPESPEEAQYSYPYPVAAALVRGRFTQREHAADVRTDLDVLALADRVDLRVDDALDARFPSECLARIVVETPTETYSSRVTRASGARDDPLADDELREKCRRLVAPTLPPASVDTTDRRLDDDGSVFALLAPWRP